MDMAEGVRLRRPRLRGTKTFRQALAWSVHCYTALGLVAAAAIAVLIVRGGTDSFRLAFVLMLVATLIDATDGTLARRIRVKEVLPGFDGRRLDDIIDFLTYTSLPLLLVWRAEILPAGLEGWLVVPLLASAYGFSQVSAKTDDGYFLGFPSYWNLVAFYLYVLRPTAWITLTLLLGLSLLTFVPSRYLYPSQRGKLNVLTAILGGVWAVILCLILFHLPVGSAVSAVAEDEFLRALTFVSLLYPIYYLKASWMISVVHWRRRRKRRKENAACSLAQAGYGPR